MNKPLNEYRITHDEFMRQWAVYEKSGRAPVATIAGRYGKWLVWPDVKKSVGDFHDDDRPVTQSFNEPFLNAQKVVNSGSHSIRCQAYPITIKAEEISDIETIPIARARRAYGSEFPR